jgi:glycosyltransferase involved in cell wall biosynthesis
MSEIKKIILLTSCFPYYPGEQFLEEEIKYWDSEFSGQLTILPINANGSPRKTPTNIKIDLSLSKKLFFFKTIFIRLKTLFSLLFLKETIYLIQKFKWPHPKCFLIAFRTIYTTLEYYYKLKNYIKKNKSSDFLIYSYWFDTAAYAAALLKRKKLVSNLVTRAHGFDVYESRRPYSYMPLKRQFKNDFDLIFAISEKGKSYLQKTYGINNHRIIVSRLGVEIPEKIGSPTDDDNTVTIVSVSNLIEVKRIDKIIKSIGLLAFKNKSLHITWHHIGTGYQLKDLEEISYETFKDSNINWNFHGEFSNKEVKEFFYRNKIDVFINTSDSEGIPVSIMEAMSYAIPAIAPNVGGVSELVNYENGLLLQAKPEVNSIFEALNQIRHFKNSNTRKKSRQHIETCFNSALNYKQFITFLERENFP